MKKFSLLFACFLLLGTAAAQQISFALEQFASGLIRPVDIAFTPADSNMYVVEQRGIIKVIRPNGTLAPQNFLDIRNKLTSRGNEQGLLGLVFHPNYATNGFFYVNYTNTNGDTHVARFRRSTANSLKADSLSETVLLFVDQPAANHNGGDLAFGPDGYLYIGLGDGGSAGDPWNNAQTNNVHLGKMLRIDVNSGTPYAIPDDNPFRNNPAYKPEIWATGLRNPWRYNFDRKTGALYIGDVGQDRFEEINFQPANSSGGENYGWRCYEANTAYNTTGCGSQSSYIAPVFAYAHGNFQNCSVTGGFVYRGCKYPRLYGKYIYSDYCSGRVWALSQCAGCPTGWDNVELANLTDQELGTFGEGNDGELWVAGLSTGRIFRVTERNELFQAPVITLDGRSLSVPDNYMNYYWYRDSDLISGENEAVLMPIDSGFYTVEVENQHGCKALSAPFYFIQTHISTDDFTHYLRLAPVPVRDVLTIFNPQVNLPRLSVTVVDLNGQILQTTHFDNPSKAIRLDLSHLPSGLYFLKIYNESVSSFVKIAKT